MADILIRMEMPKDCGKCFVGDRTICSSDCPLHELPEHGDLISKQTALAALHSDYAYAAMDIIEKEVPVVIPSNKEETE